MPRPRNTIPTCLVGRKPELIAAFWRHYAAAVEFEKTQPVEVRFVSKRGPNDIAIGWLMHHDAREGGRRTRNAPAAARAMAALRPALA